MSPLVLVPPMRSKYSQGRGEVAEFLRRASSSMRSRRMRREDSPRTPPLSRPRIRGQDGGAGYQLEEVDDSALRSIDSRG